MDDLNTIVVRYQDHVTTEDVVRAFAEYQKSDAHDPDHNYLVDMSQAKSLDIDFKRMLTMVFKLGPLHNLRTNGTKTAFFAPEDLSFGMARMYQSIASDQVNFEIGVYRDLAPAVNFLGLDQNRLDIDALPRDGT